MHLLPRLFIFLALLASCTPDKKAVTLDESNLESVLSFFYHPGSLTSDAAATYNLLSARSREQVSQKQWEDLVAAQTSIITSATVVKKASVKGVTYAVVSLSEAVNGATSTSTATWILENNKWGRIKLPVTMEFVNSAFKKSDVGAAKTAAKRWLTLDPFSTQAVETLIYCAEAERSGENDPTARDKEIASLIKELLSTNPNDTRALYLAVSHARDVASGKPYLGRLEGTAAYQAAADALAAKAKRPDDDAAHAPDDAALLLRKLIVLADRNQMKEFKKLGSDSNTIDRLIAYLAEKHPDDAAELAGKLGIAYYKAGIRKSAAQWLEFGKERNPDNKRILMLEAQFAEDKGW